MEPTRFYTIYNSFLSKITQDMYLQLTEKETKELLRQLLMSAIPKFEFPRKELSYEYRIVFHENGEDKNRYYSIWRTFEGKDYYDYTQDERFQDKDIIFQGWTFTKVLNLEQINILATYMIVQWLGQQLASVENVRMKYSGSDFKFTSQANHMQKLLQMKKDYEREGFHLQRLYKRRAKDVNGVYRSTFNTIMKEPEEYALANQPAASPQPTYEDLVEWQDF